MNFHLGICITSLIVVLFTSQGFPHQTNFTGFLIASIMIDINLTKFLVSLCVLGCLIISYDETFVKAGYAPPLLFPGPAYTPTLTDFLTREAISMLAVATCWYLNKGQYKEHTRSLESAEAAVEMAQGLADKLLAYDTEGEAVG